MPCQTGFCNMAGLPAASGLVSTLLRCLHAHAHAFVLSATDTILEVANFSMSAPVKAKTADASAKHQCCCVSS